MRAGAAYFLEPSEAAQRRYEAMRAYFVDGLAASEVATRFGYSPASVHQMASELRTGSAQYFRSSKPGPRSARKADRVRNRVLELRALLGRGDRRRVDNGRHAGGRANGLDDP
jgi:transposase